MHSSNINYNDDYILVKNYIEILKIMSPIVPHFANECLEDLSEKSEVSWPKVNEKYLIKEASGLVGDIPKLLKGESI